MERGFAAEDMLTTKDEIKVAFNLSEYMFWEFIEQGMPAVYLKGRWSASIRAINDWWRNSRNVQMRGMIKEIRADEEKNATLENRPQR
ncbi:MAG TPA: hypothetical protein VMT62_06490 [Syntrophorhabdaceae bacterium]|nr:hypothetical protein [Syntrophorhabdaceae bacterium]